MWLRAAGYPIVNDNLGIPSATLTWEIALTTVPGLAESLWMWMLVSNAFLEARDLVAF